jgi:hypothetical protein
VRGTRKVIHLIANANRIFKLDKLYLYSITLLYLVRFEVFMAIKIQVVKTVLRNVDILPHHSMTSQPGLWLADNDKSWTQKIFIVLLGDASLTRANSEPLNDPLTRMADFGSFFWRITVLSHLLVSWLECLAGWFNDWIKYWLWLHHLLTVIKTKQSVINRLFKKLPTVFNPKVHHRHKNRSPLYPILSRLF